MFLRYDATDRERLRSDTDCCESFPSPPHDSVRSDRYTVTTIRMTEPSGFFALPAYLLA
jgi:hypothetical protein